MLSDQLNAGHEYHGLKAAVGIHLLDFDLFTKTSAQKQQAFWRFEMRDAQLPEVKLGDELQLNILELKKADQLKETDNTLISEALSNWITFFEHWQEEALMANIYHAPIQKAMHRIKQLSADENAKRLAFVRERALHDEASLIYDAKQEGREEGELKAKEAMAKSLIALAVLTDEQIVAVTGLPLETVQALRH